MFLVAACLNSSACTFIQTLPSSMSIVWFPAHLRNLATSLAVLSYGAGSALGFFVGARALRSFHNLICPYGTTQHALAAWNRVALRDSKRAGATRSSLAIHTSLDLRRSRRVSLACHSNPNQAMQTLWRQKHHDAARVSISQ